MKKLFLILLIILLFSKLYPQGFNCDSVVVLKSGVTHDGNTEDGQANINAHPYYNGGAPDWPGKEVIHKITADMAGRVSVYEHVILTGHEDGCLDLFVYPDCDSFFSTGWISSDNMGQLIDFDSIEAEESRYFIVDTKKDCEEKEYTLTITFPEKDITSVIENNQISFSVYPNPTRGFITVKTEFNKNFTIEIFNISGIKLLTLYSKEKEQTFNISNLNPGIYLIKISYNKTQILTKLIKQ